MTYAIRFKKTAEKELEKLPKQAIRQLEISIDSLAENPKPVGSKKLQGLKETFFRIRVGNYRVIYTIDEKTKIVEIRRVGDRKNIYR